MDPRYARHLLLPEVGAPGQAALCAHEATVTGHPRAAEIAGDYLRRAGVRCVRSDVSPQRTQRTQRGGKEVGSADSASSAVQISPEAVADLAGRPELEEAAAWLAGAFAAVEAIKAVVGAGTPHTLEGVRLSGVDGPTDGGVRGEDEASR